jgi:hypothetical protein
MGKICTCCSKEVWEGSEPAKRFSPEGHHHMFDHKEMCYWVRESQAGMWAGRHPEPKAGKTLADFANSLNTFKRPKHGNAYVFLEHLLEIDANGRLFLPKLTAEDLTATDWEEVE